MGWWDDVAPTAQTVGGGWGASAAKRRATAEPASSCVAGAGWGGGSGGSGVSGAVSSLLGSADDVVVAVAQACLARGATRSELVAELARLLSSDDAETLATLLTGDSVPAPRRAAAAGAAPRRAPPPVWAAAEQPSTRLPIAELRARLRLLGISTQGMTERSELESAHRRAMWPPPEPEPEPEALAMAELHRQLLRLALYLAPDAVERAARDALALRVAALVHRACPGDPPARRYGSERLGLAAFTSDIDMCVDVSRSSSRSGRAKTLRWIGAALRQTSWARKVDVRENARVPIINFEDDGTGLEVDISLEHCETTELVEALRADYTALEPLALVLKVLLEQADLNTPYTGGLGSFKLYVLIGHYLSCRNRDAEPWAAQGALGVGALGVLLIGLLRHASEYFDWDHTFTFAGGVRVEYASVYGSDRVADYCAEMAEQLQKELDQEATKLKKERHVTQRHPDESQPVAEGAADGAATPTERTEAWRGLMRTVEADRLSAKREAARSMAILTHGRQEAEGEGGHAAAEQQKHAAAGEMAGAAAFSARAESSETNDGNALSDGGYGSYAESHSEDEGEDDWEISTAHGNAKGGKRRSTGRKRRKQEKRERRKEKKRRKKSAHEL